MKYVKVCEEEDEPTIELPLEEDNTLLLSTLTCQFSKATGLKYKTKDSGIYRGVRFASDRFFPPQEGWDGFTYSCVLLKDNKRKGEEDNHSIPKTKKIDNKKCTDLIVLNIPWRTDDDALRMYFSKFGEVVMVQVKREPDTMKSKGYAFIRFAEYDAQVMCLAEQHCIDNRWCEVKIPYSKMAAENSELRNKIHVGRLSEAVTADVLRSFFNQYGKVESIYIPRPFRSFAFVTFEDENTAQNLLGRELKINDDCVVTISAASPKINHNNQKSINGSHQGYGHWNAYEDDYGGAFGMMPGDTRSMQHRGGRHGVGGATGAMHGGKGLSNSGSSPHQMQATTDWSPFLTSHSQAAAAAAAAVVAAGRHPNHHQAGHQAGHHHVQHVHPHHQQQQQQQAVLASAHHHHHQQVAAVPAQQAPAPYPTAADISQNTTAMAALNIINNPSVVAAIMSAAAARASQGDVGSTAGHLMPPTVSTGHAGFLSKPGEMGGAPTGQPTAAQQQQQQQQTQQFLYSQIAANQNNWGY